MSRNQTWKSVSRPNPSLRPPQSYRADQGPVVPPKPKENMFFYVYEAPKPSNSDPTGIYYPRSDECVKYEKSKWKRKRKNVLPVSRPSITSKGGIMFQKQQKRINEHVDSSPSNELAAEYGENVLYKLPGNQAPNYSTVKIEKPIQRSTYKSKKTKRSQKMTGPVIRPLQSPPPEWRAKVEANYKLESDPISAQQSLRQYEPGYQSAPEDDGGFDDSYFLEEDEQNYLRSVSYESVAAREERPAMFYFSGRKPRRINKFTGLAFVSTPFTYYDFNARPVGWSNAYAKNY